MVIDSEDLGRELRRRRVGRPALLRTLAETHRSTWLPGDLDKAPTSLLVLAAMSLTRPTPG